MSGLERPPSLLPHLKGPGVLCPGPVVITPLTSPEASVLAWRSACVLIAGGESSSSK